MILPLPTPSHIAEAESGQAFTRLGVVGLGPQGAALPTAHPTGVSTVGVTGVTGVTGFPKDSFTRAHGKSFRK